MSDKKELKISNKSDRPDNIVLRDHLLIEKSMEYEKRLPSFMKDYFVYLRGSVAVSTRAAYLEDIIFFCDLSIIHIGLLPMLCRRFPDVNGFLNCGRRVMRNSFSDCKENEQTDLSH